MGDASAPVDARPRVLIVGNFLAERGAVHNVCYDLRDRLRARGYDVRWTSRFPAPAARVMDMLASTWRWRHQYDVAQVDVFSGRAFRWAEWVTRLLARLGKPMVLTLHGGALPEFAARHPARVRRVLGRAASVTSPSPFLERALAGLGHPITVLPNPLDLASFPFQRRAPSGPAILWLRAFQDIYQPLLALDVLARVRAACPTATLTMVGPDRDGSLGAVRARIAHDGLDRQVRVIEGVPHARVPALMHEHDVFLNTSRVDNAPVSLVEALACGLPVVSTSAGGIPDLLVDGRTGLLSAPDDPGGLATSLIRLVREPERAGALSSAGRSYVETHYAWEALLPRWEELLGAATRRS